MNEPLVVEVFHPYRAQEKHQLTIAVGEKLTVIEKDPSGWWAGRNAKGVAGLFPSTYTRKATTVAPTADVTREVVSARILAELGMSEAKQHASSKVTSTAMDGFTIHTDLDFDDVYALTDAELEVEVRRLVRERDQGKRKFAERLKRVVDQTLARRKNDDSSTTDAVPTFASRDAETQRLKIGKKRLEELIVQESQLRSEFRELEGAAKRRSVPIPQCLQVPQVMTLVAHERETLTPVVTPVAEREVPADMVQVPSSGPAAAADDESWLSGVSNVAHYPYLKGLQSKLMALNEHLDAMEAELDPLTTKLNGLDSQLSKKQELLDQLADSHQEKVRELFAHWEERVSIAQREYADLKSGGNRGPQLVAALNEQIGLLEKQVESGKRQHSKVDAEVGALKSRWDELQSMQALHRETEKMHHEIRELTHQEAALHNEVEACEAQGRKALQDDQVLYKKLERKRREIYNQIQELKGNLRVYCRIKPRAPSEPAGYLVPVDDMTVRVVDPETEQMTEHEFDLVIGEEATQEEIFEEVRPLATSVLDGFNVCIFAYGQTGSGKTYTMEGPPNNRGINFRAVRELFQIANDRGDEYHCVLKMSILEVYNDKLFDLQNKRSACKVRWGGGTLGVVIEPIVKSVVNSVDEVQAALEKAYLSRSVAGTDCNAHSSRSHCILTIYVDATNSATLSTVTGKLHLIDLAGSERVKNSGVEGDRLREATHINTSLTHLKTVIQGLAKKTSHVAYRNCTLTAMLQDSLGGNCKCLMFANVSAAPTNSQESTCTMKYAAEARKVEVGKVTANVKQKT